MRKVVRLTESDLVRIVKRVIRESEDEVYDDNDDLIGHYSLDKDRLDTARFIPNQKGTEKGHSMGANTPERSYKKPARDSGMGRLTAKDDFERLRPERMRPERMKSRRDDFDLNENDGEREESPMKQKIERAISSVDRLDQLIELFGGERHLDGLLSQYRPFGLSSLDDLIEYKGGYPEEEY